MNHKNKIIDSVFCKWNNPEHHKKSLYGNFGVQLYKGAFEIKHQPKKIQPHPSIIKIYDTETTYPHKIKTKVVVLDLDETIGSFTDLYCLWNIIKLHYDIPTMTSTTSEPTPKKMSWEYKQNIFNELLDLYPEMLRTNIISMLEFLHVKIKNGECKKLYIYTNNQCIFPEWICLIISYLNYCLDVETSIFDKPICAFKIKNKVVEKKRTTNKKTHEDLIKCTLIPKNAEICFVDDKEHEHMKCDKIYYIQPPPYYHSLTKPEIIRRFVNSTLYLLKLKQLNGETIVPHLNTGIIPYGHYSNVDVFEDMTDEKMEMHNMDVSRKMFYYIREFFFLSVRKPKTKKIQFNLGKYTKRKRV